MSELDNCSKCGKLFVRTIRTVCQECHKIEEKQFDIVYSFMKKRVNREATIPEIVEGTGVKESLIIKFVREKRLRSSQFPNLTYPCERCERPISTGKICEVCTTELSKELVIEDQIRAVEKRNKAEQRKKVKTYYALDKTKKRD